MSLVAMDMFAGGGGLTVGLKKAGFNVVAAVEKEPSAFSTYCVNHPEVHAFHQDITTISGQILMEKAGVDHVDLLAGCPPCQGFTSLTAKYKREDARNALVLEMGRMVQEILPGAIMMENVPGLVDKGKRLSAELRETLTRLGYVLTEGVLQVADYGVPQSRRRFVLLAGLGFKIELPEPTHSRIGAGGLPVWRTVRDTISDMKSPITLAEAKRQKLMQGTDWHLVRDLSELNMLRMRAAKPGKNWVEIPEKIRPACHRGEYRGFSNVYGRMEWDKPAPTITGGCTTFSKGRFGHPEEDRTISVREAALLQTFPRNYKFDTPFMDRVCNLIGNALPCDFAEAVSRECHSKLLYEG